MPEARHVIPKDDGGWVVRKAGSARASSVHATQKAAIDRARDIVRRAGGGEILIHARDGRIRDSDTVFAGPRQGTAERSTGHTASVALCPETISKPEGFASGRSEGRGEDPVGHVLGQVIPIYFVADVSRSMDGEPIDALNRALDEMLEAFGNEPAVGEKVRFGIITFAQEAASVLDLAELDHDLVLPTLVTRGVGTRYSTAFRTLRTLVPADVFRLTSQRLEVMRPIVFFMSDGAPTEDECSWRRPLEELHDTSFRERPLILAFGIGDADPDIIREVATAPRYAWMASDAEPSHAGAHAIGAALLGSMTISAESLAQGEAPLYVPEVFVSLAT